MTVRYLRTDARLWLIAVLLLITLIALPILTYPLGRDQGEFATIARGTLNGRTPYTELWNPKPPAVFYVYAAAISLFGQTSDALRAIDLIIVPLIAAALYGIGVRLSNLVVGLWAALIFAVFYFTESFWTLTQNDGIVLLPMTLAVLCLLLTRPNVPNQVSNVNLRVLVLAFCSGALCAYVFWFKYPFALFGAALLLGFVLVARPRLPIVAVFIVGGLLVMLAAVLILVGQGAWDELLLSARVTSQYTTLTFNWDDFSELMQTALGFRWSQWGLLALLGASWFVVRRWGGAVNRTWLLVLIWLLAGGVIMLVQAKGYDYHWLPMLPPLCLLAADALRRLVFRLEQAGIAAHFAATVAGTLLLAILIAGIWPNAWKYLTGQETQSSYYSRFVGGEVRADESQAVIDYLRARTTPGDSLYIWGFRPEVYYLTGLNPATRFIFQFPLVGEWYPGEWQEENVETLWAALPPYVLVLQVDYMPWVTGSQDDSNTLLQRYTELNNWLIFNYERETQIGNFFIWRRKN
ncbi:MAG: glycosyltransferase family 39 protein [Anaerolineae bacterium]|nr:glycosyltransferase family 39 protein [Anaerolineae bacterium]